jgi:hypothetical protein
MLYEFVVTFIFTFLIVATISFIVKNLLLKTVTRDKKEFGILISQSILITILLTWII